jgi:hypothetical protein
VDTNGNTLLARDCFVLNSGFCTADEKTNKVKFTQEQAINAQRWIGGIALLFL